jgi:hypothetical protein
VRAPRFLRRLLRRERAAAEAPPIRPAARGLGEPPAQGEADDAELDALRGELMRELDRLATDGGGSAGFRRG